jgi:hypothetical protein
MRGVLVDGQETSGIGRSCYERKVSGDVTITFFGARRAGKTAEIEKGHALSLQSILHPPIAGSGSSDRSTQPATAAAVEDVVTSLREN